MSGLTNLFITGGTGFVGKAVVSRLIDAPKYDKIYMLVRPQRRKNAEQRVRDMILKIFPKHRTDDLLSKIVAVQGDITLPGLGMCESDIKKVSDNVQQFLHVGASTEFGAPLDISRLNNVEGTRHVLALASLCQKEGVFERFDYVSTAFVAGRKVGTVDEDDLSRGQEFSNNYERSKYEAEILVKEYEDQFPIAIYRPSIVVGDSNSGYTPHFKVLYWPLVLLSRNLIKFLPVNGKAHLDVVPVDYVADGIIALMHRSDSLGETFHLTAGLGDEICISELLKDSYDLAEIKKRPIVPFTLFSFIYQNRILQKFLPADVVSVVKLAEPYSYYLKGNRVLFNASKTHDILRNLGVTVPKWQEYKKEVLKFCPESNWGRKLPLPEYVYYLPVSSRKETWRELSTKSRQNLSIPSPV
jgi:thioester reductase-like protein